MRRMLGVVAVMVAVFGMVGSAHSAGFALIEQSVSGLGNAFAGGSAAAEDASVVYFNPAGMTHLQGFQTVVGLHLIDPQAKFTNEGSTHVLQSFNPAAPALSGGNGGQGGEAGISPNLYYTETFDSGWSFGLGVNAPFGLSTDYDQGWVGRYQALHSELKTVNINPSVAVRINDVLSIGAGFNAMYLDAELTNAIDFGTLDALPVAAGGFGGAFGLTPQGADGYVKLKGNSWGFGYNAGLLLDLSADTRIGVAYRSKVIQDVEGTADFSNVPAGISAVTGGYFTATSVKAKVTLPSTFSVSLHQRINDQWAAMADVTRTGWSSFNELRFKFANGQPDGVTTENWKDSYRYALGATYRPTHALVVRVGAAYDKTPIPDPEHRTPRIPDGDRLWTTVGAGYRVTEHVGVDAAYAHLFVKDPKIDKSSFSLPEDALRGGLRGSYDAAVDIASVQLNVAF
jgi:long-chain fatty acid transport protein